MRGGVRSRPGRSQGDDHEVRLGGDRPEPRWDVLRTRPRRPHEVVRETLGPFDGDDRHAPLDSQSDFLECALATSGEQGHARLRVRELVDEIEQQRRAPAAPLIAVRENEARVIWVERRDGRREPRASFAKVTNRAGATPSSVASASLSATALPSTAMTPDWVPPSTRIAPAAEPARTAPRSSRRPSRRPTSWSRDFAPPITSRTGQGRFSPRASTNCGAASRGPASAARAVPTPGNSMSMVSTARSFLWDPMALPFVDKIALPACPHTRMCRLGARPAHCHKRGKSPSATSTRGPSCAVAAMNRHTRASGS